MAEQQDDSKFSGLELALVVGGGIVAVLVAFWVLSFVVGIIWFAVKAVAVLAVIGVILWLIFRRD
jgi:hypothetical protein